jgi:hypothetical protein
MKGKGKGKMLLQRFFSQKKRKIVVSEKARNIQRLHTKEICAKEFPEKLSGS